MYQTINIEQFRNVLPKARGWHEIDGFGEYVLQWQIPSMPTGTFIKVYTSIRKSNGLSRFKDTDAIRVCCTHKQNGLVRSERILRVPGWQDRVRNEVIRVLGVAKSRRHWIKDNGQVIAPD